MPHSLFGETACASRFSGDASLAMHNGTSPLPVSSGKSQRHRLNRCGNRHLNPAVSKTARRVTPRPEGSNPSPSASETPNSSGSSRRWSGPHVAGGLWAYMFAFDMSMLPGPGISVD
ncbi:MAG: transposase [Actinomycetota bacterium]|nr:transposase [Actinomycetota bacterium]